MLMDFIVMNEAEAKENRPVTPSARRSRASEVIGMLESTDRAAFIDIVVALERGLHDVNSLITLL